MPTTPEALAAIAAQLLDGGNYRDAARRALALLAACREELASEPIAFPPAPVGSVPPPTSPAPALPEWMNFRELLHRLTGRHGSEARKIYADFLRWALRADRAKAYHRYGAADPEVRLKQWLAGIDEVPEPGAAEVGACISEEKKRTFPPAEVARLTEIFSEWRERETSARNAAKGKKGGRGKKFPAIQKPRPASLGHRPASPGGRDERR